MNKKILLIVATLFIAMLSDAVPARPGLFRYTQPDGSVIMLRRHGDEHYNWTTDASGQVMKLDSDGFYRRSNFMPERRPSSLGPVPGQDRAPMAIGDSDRKNPLCFGVHYIPVILMEFADNEFTIQSPASQFDKMLNQKGYSDNGGTGSVRDYYIDNSHGQYTPVFEVFSPVKLQKSLLDYNFDKNNGGDLGNAALAIADAARLLDDQIDFSKYDSDNDGRVDMILVYYPGHNPAEGGPASNIWPHQWSVMGKQVVYLDGTVLDRYFCTSELKGSAGSTMCGIGTTSHEFAHSLGLPDFYDVNYDEDGTSLCLVDYSLMCSGCYNNDGRTPPYLNIEERMMLGWVENDALRDLPAGVVGIPSIDNDVAYKSQTSAEGEYFVYECRDGSSWDSFVPPGMIVYHVDKSDRMVGTFSTASYLWQAGKSLNQINFLGAHPCFYIVPAPDPGNLMYGMRYYEEYGYAFEGGNYLAKLPFPGQEDVTEFCPVDWNGSAGDIYLSDISYADGKVTVKVSSVADAELADAGFNSIDPGSYYEHYDGEVFQLRVLESSLENKPVAVDWYYDGLPVDGPTVTLRSGVHTVKALLTLSDGREEELEMELNCL